MHISSMELVTCSLLSLAPGDNCVGEEGEAHTPKLSYNCMERKYFRKNFVKFEL